MAQPVIVDSHMHIYQSRVQGLQEKQDYEIWEYGSKTDVRYSSYGGDVEDALKAINEAGATHGVLVNLFAARFARRDAIAELPEGLDEAQKEQALVGIDATMGERLQKFNGWLCDEAEAHSELVPFIAIDPWALSADEAKAHLREMVDHHGARGVKVHPVLQQFSMGDQRMMPVYETCVEMGVPIIAHAGPARGDQQYAEPKAFAEVLVAFPELTLVLAHLGGGAWGQALQIAQTFPNACFDCSEIMEWTGGSNAPTDRELAQLISDVGPERVMMGSDFPWYDIDHNVERVMNLPLLSREQKEEMLGSNAMRIFGL